MSYFITITSFLNMGLGESKITQNAVENIKNVHQKVSVLNLQ